MKVLMDTRRAVVLALFATALALLGAVAAHADNTGYSTYCTDNSGAYPSTETGVPGTGLSFETGTTGRRSVAVCYSTTPNGSSSPEAAGGRVVAYGPDEFDRYRLLCQGDRTTNQTVAVDCDVVVTPTDPSAAPGTTATGSAKVGATGPVNVGQTGAEVANPATTTNAPLGGAVGSGGSLGTGGGTCTYVNGGTPTCPFGAVTILGVTVNEADLVPAVTQSTPTPPCTGVNNTCVPVGATVRVFQDTSNPTLSVTTVTSSSPTTVDAAPTGTCVQVNATC